MKEPTFNIGIEEEYQIVDPTTRELRSYITQMIEDQTRALIEVDIKPELHQSIVEVGTKVCQTPAEAREELVRLRRGVIELAARHGLKIVAAGTHPFSNWMQQEITPFERYAGVREDMQILAQQLLIFGTHVHIGIEDREVLIDVMNVARYLMPHILCLSTSSPFWMGQQTGLMSYRSVVFRNFPRTGTAPRFGSYAEFQHYLDTLVKTNSIPDGTKIWWDLRPNHKYPTLEMRICDVCTRVDEAACIAAIFQAICYKCWKLRRSNLTFRVYSSELIEENKWRAVRYGLDGKLIDFGKQEELPARALVSEMIEWFIGDVIDELGSRREVEYAFTIMREGTSAHRQLQTYQQTGDLKAVVDRLIHETAEGCCSEMGTFVPRGFREIAGLMHAAHDDILDALARHGIRFPDYPSFDQPGNPCGVAAAKAHPMQGILKYHGLADWQWRTAFMPSISVTNSAAYSITLVAFDPDLSEDEATIDGRRVTGRDLERIRHSLNAVRNLAAIRSCARVYSRNVVAGGALRAGKGLGTSASGSAALAMAAIAAVFGEGAIRNARFVSAMSRLLAGSGCRSAAGGVALWMSYPGIPHEDSFAVRLDTRDQLTDLRLITIPLDSRIGLKTEQAHADAPNSPLFKCWMRNRRDEVLRCIEAVMAGDWLTLAQMAEADSIVLHAVTMTGGVERKLFAWEPENITLFRACNDLRAADVPVYFSTDTGPTTVLLTHKQFSDQVMAHIRGLGFEAVEGQIAPGAHLVTVEEAQAELGVRPN